MSKFEDKFVAVGKVLPVQKRDKSTPVKGLKACLFQEGSDKMVDFDTGVIVWKRDAEDVLNGRAAFAYIYKGVVAEEEAEAKVPASIKPKVR